MSALSKSATYLYQFSLVPRPHPLGHTHLNMTTLYLVFPGSLQMLLKRSSQFLVSSTLLAFFCLGADHVIFQRPKDWNKLFHGQLLRGVCDSSIHGFVAGWSWFNYTLFIVIKSRGWKGCGLVEFAQIVTCTVVSTAIDLDHVIEARSLSTKVS